MRRVITIATLVLCGLLAGGCGKEEAPTPKVTEPPPAPPEKVAAKEPAPKPEPKQEEPKAKEPEAPAPSAEELDAMVEKILGLEQDGQFAEAMQLCREASSRFRAHPKATALLEISARLREERKAAVQLPFAIQKLTSPDPDVAQVASRELLEAGDVALILLRKALRNDDGDLAVQATKLLAHARDKRAAQPFVAKLLKSPPAPLRKALCEGLKALVDVAGRDVFSALYTLVKDDEAAKNWELAGILCVAFDKRCGGKALKFEELVGDPAAAKTLEAYVAKAIEAYDPIVAEWARSAAPLMGVVATGLRGSYFQGTNFEKLVFERLDPKIDFTDKTLGFPDGKADAVSVRWTGYLLVQRDGNYMIISESDDGQKLWIDGKLQIDDWGEHGPQEQRAGLVLRKGFHEIKIDYMNSSGQGLIKLSWDGPGFNNAVIPPSAFRTLPWKGMKKAEAQK